MSDPARNGDWMLTATGGIFYPLDPLASEVRIEDIAQALSQICRFGGHTPEFYSVAQHSVLVSHACDPADALWGLLHDASEAYLADIIRPVKRHIVGYREAEARVMVAVCERFGLALEEPASVTIADGRVLGAEKRDILPHPPRVWDAPDPINDRITPWPREEAKHRFLARFAELEGGAR